MWMDGALASRRTPYRPPCRTEIVGLVPKRALVEAGKYFLRKQRRSTGVAEEEIIRIAVKSMGLDDLKPFDAKDYVEAII